jgi:hypothetical protein
MFDYEHANATARVPGGRAAIDLALQAHRARCQVAGSGGDETVLVEYCGRHKWRVLPAPSNDEGDLTLLIQVLDPDWGEVIVLGPLDSYDFGGPIQVKVAGINACGIQFALMAPTWMAEATLRYFRYLPVLHDWALVPA